MSTNLIQESQKFSAGIARIKRQGFFNGLAVEVSLAEDGQLSGFLLRISGLIPNRSGQKPKEGPKAFVDPDETLSKLMGLVQGRALGTFEAEAETGRVIGVIQGELLNLSLRCSFNK